MELNGVDFARIVEKCTAVWYSRGEFRQNAHTPATAVGTVGCKRAPRASASIITSGV
jgi:hypothetical protein